MAQGATQALGSKKPQILEKQKGTLHPGEGAGSDGVIVKRGERRPRLGVGGHPRSDPSLWKPSGS
jgi:hypothetical protein